MNGENPPVEASKEASTPKKSAFGSIVKELFIFALIALGIVLPFRLYVAEPYLVDGRSMSPTFETADYLIVNKLSFELRGTLPRGAVVVFKFPGDTSKNFIKRVIGLPGETVTIANGKVTIANAEHPEGFALDDSFVAYPSQDNMTKTLASDEYFVMGDNRAESYDSRAWGPLNEKYILGEPVLRLFPFTKIAVDPGTKTL
jgi:signal peptidase I